MARYIFRTRIDAVLDTERAPRPPAPAALGPCWFDQDQGDAVRFPGFSATVDVDRFWACAAGETGERARWLQARIGTDVDGAFGEFGEHTTLALQAWQAQRNLPSTGVVDLATFAPLSWSPVS